MGSAWNAIEKIQGMVTTVLLSLNTAMNAAKTRATGSANEAEGSGPPPVIAYPNTTTFLARREVNSLSGRATLRLFPNRVSLVQ